MAFKFLIPTRHRICLQQDLPVLIKGKQFLINGWLISPLATPFSYSDFLFVRHNSSDVPLRRMSPIASLQQPTNLENTFAFKVLQTHSETVKNIFSEFSKIYLKKNSLLSLSEVSQMTWDDITPKLIDQFQYLSEQQKLDDCLLSHEAFTPMTEALISRIKDMTDEDILRILRCLSCWPAEKSTSGNFYNLFHALDKECVKRIQSWSRSRILFVSLHWYLSNLASKSDFVYCGSKKVARKPFSLTAQELTQLMFFFNLLRTYPIVNMVEVEWKMYEQFNNFSIQELGILCLGFFKSKTMMKEPKLLEALIKRYIENIETIPDFTSTAILKCVRLSAKHHHLDLIANELMPALIPQVDRHPFVVCVHIAGLLTKCNIVNDEMFQILAQKLIENLKTARIKEWTFIITCLSNLNYKCKRSPNVYELVVSELQSPARKQEIMEHPKTLGVFLSKIAVLEMYPEALLSQAFSTDFLVHSYGKKLNRFSVPPHMMQLHFSVKIEAPSYQGPLLSPELIEDMSHHSGWFIPRETSTSKADKLMYSMYCQLSDLLGGQDFAKLIWTIPSFKRPDVIFCLDGETGKPLPIPEEIKAKTYLTATLPSTKGKWYSVFGMCEFGHCYQTGQPVGFMKLRERLLTKLGYKPLFENQPHMDLKFSDNILFVLKKIQCEMPYNKLLDLSEEERLNFIKKLINYSEMERRWKEEGR